MADDVTLPANTGTFIAASDDVGGVQYQKIKLIDGTDASATVIPAKNADPGASDYGLVVRDAGTLSRFGTLTETAPASDTASSGLNGRLQRIAQRLTSILAVLPTALTAGGFFKVSIAEDLVGSAVGDDDGSLAGAQTNVALTLGMPYTYVGTAWLRGPLTPYKLNSAASTNATSLKASAGILGFAVVTNTNAAVRYFKLYNKASAPTVGTDTPVQVYGIPGATTGGGIAIPLPEKGLGFSTGIAFAIVTGAADADTNAVAANEVIVNLGYQ